MEKTWVLIANAERARCFERHATDHSLTELADFVHPYPQTNIISETSLGDRSGDAGKGHGRTGHAGTQFESHTEPHAKERGIFARQLADYLNKGVAEQRCNGLVLITSSPMLGKLRPLLSSAAEKMVQSSVTSDLTRYTGPELKERIDHALRLPD
ncbi:MAG: host attachment protein [Burkholderiaceae bacterium]|nr:host attachment protein [Burkholderiaceae bacterium]